MWLFQVEHGERVDQRRRGLDATRPGQEVVAALGVVPGGAHGDEVGARPLDGVVVPRRVGGVDTPGGQRVDQRAGLDLGALAAHPGAGDDDPGHRAATHVTVPGATSVNPASRTGATPYSSHAAAAVGVGGERPGPARPVLPRGRAHRRVAAPGRGRSPRPASDRREDHARVPDLGGGLADGLLDLRAQPDHRHPGGGCAGLVGREVGAADLEPADLVGHVVDRSGDQRAHQLAHRHAVDLLDRPPVRRAGTPGELADAPGAGPRGDGVEPRPVGPGALVEAERERGGGRRLEHRRPRRRVALEAQDQRHRADDTVVGLVLVGSGGVDEPRAHPRRQRGERRGQRHRRHRGTRRSRPSAASANSISSRVTPRMNRTASRYG